MTQRDKILAMLRSANGAVTYRWLVRTVGISAAQLAVQITKLRTDGVQIINVRCFGYRIINP